ncbi:hypothetical protein [Photobacterium leiognathi]|uniref:hypothetical protein n=1 Tax=Photobacterium leiognathi TaxID=553611 RepID=UPI00273A502A|nr:hypothetical protein [Photobacterium leiognathi]
MDLIYYESIGDTLYGKARYVYIGVDIGDRYIREFTEDKFIKAPIVLNRTKVSLAQAVNISKCSRADLMMIAVPQTSIDQFKKPNDVICPMRLHQVIDVSMHHEKCLGFMSKRESKRYNKLIERYDYDISKHPRDFVNFYKKMHKPTMIGRYGNFARSVDIKKAFFDIFRKGQLFYIKNNDQYVAGSVSIIDGDTVNARLIGVLNGDNHYLKDGAQNFVYHAIIHWACNNDVIKKVDFQGCEPFLTKSTYQYKSRMGTKIIIPKNEFGDKRLIIRTSGSKPAIDFMINNPAIGISDTEELCAVYTAMPDGKYRSDIPYNKNGIGSHIII